MTCPNFIWEASSTKKFDTCVSQLHIKVVNATNGAGKQIACSFACLASTVANSPLAFVFVEPRDKG